MYRTEWSRRIWTSWATDGGARGSSPSGEGDNPVGMPVRRSQVGLIAGHSSRLVARRLAGYVARIARFRTRASARSAVSDTHSAGDSEAHIHLLVDTEKGRLEMNFKRYPV